MTDSRIEPWPYARRRVRGSAGRALERYSALVGEVTWASNLLNGEFLFLLRNLLARDEKELAEQIWHSLRSDDLQRTVVRAAAIKSPRITARMRKSILWALDRAGKLSEFRNDAIHTAFSLQWKPGGFYFVPDGFASHPKRVDKLERVGYKKLFRTLIGDMMQLWDYVGWINLKTAHWNHEARTMPSAKRPRAQSILLVQRALPKSNNPIARPQSRKRRQRPSRR